MEADKWSRLSAPLMRHQSTLLSRYDLYLGFEEMEGEEEELRVDFLCPFCDEDFDIVCLCCHIDDEHTFEAKNGVCPICLRVVGMDMVGHITMQHADLLKSQNKRILQKGSSGSHGAQNFLRKELWDGSLHSLLGVSSRLITPSHAEPDPLLSSFISNVPIADSSRLVEPEPLHEGIKKICEEKVVESAALVLCDKDTKEMVRRSQFAHFAHELLLSTIFDDILLR